MNYWIDRLALRLMAWRLALAKLTPGGDERSAQMIKRLKPRQAQRLAYDIFTHRENGLGSRFVRWGWCPRTRRVLDKAMLEYLESQREGGVTAFGVWTPLRRPEDA